MARSNFSYEKRQKELERKKKKEEKQQRKQEKSITPPDRNEDQIQDEMPQKLDE